MSLLRNVFLQALCVERRYEKSEKRRFEKRENTFLVERERPSEQALAASEQAKAENKTAQNALFYSFSWETCSKRPSNRL